MKKYIFCIPMTFFSILSFSQTQNVLYGSRWNGQESIFNELNLSSKSLVDKDIEKDVFLHEIGEYSIDAEHKRYFFLTNLGITIVNFESGILIDTILNSINLNAIVYNPNSNMLMGLRNNGINTILTTLDLDTKIFTDIKAIPEILWYQLGDITFNEKHNRYIISTNLGITIIDAQTGMIIDTIDNTIGLQGIEYDPNTNKLFGTYSTDTLEIFASLDLAIKKYSIIDTLHDVFLFFNLESTLDVTNKRYFNSTNLGITIIDFNTGSIIDTIDNSIGMFGFQYPNPKITKTKEVCLDKTVIAYPNPAGERLIINADENLIGEYYTVFNLLQDRISSGKIMNKEFTIDVSEFTQGIYFIQMEGMKDLITFIKL